MSGFGDLEASTRREGGARPASRGRAARSGGRSAERTRREREELFGDRVPRGPAPSAEERTTAALRDALNTANDTLAVGESTAEELSRQREVLERSRAKAARVDDMMSVASYTLRGMSSFTGRIANAFTWNKPTLSATPPPPPITGTSASATRATAGSERRASSTARGTASGHRAGSFESGSGGETSGTAASRRRSAPSNAHASRHGRGAMGGGGSSVMVSQARREQDELLDGLHETLGRLKETSLKTSEELDTQDRMLDDIKETIDSADTKMRKSRRTARRIIRNG